MKPPTLKEFSDLYHINSGTTKQKEAANKFFDFYDRLLSAKRQDSFWYMLELMHAAGGAVYFTDKTCRLNVGRWATVQASATWLYMETANGDLEIACNGEFSDCFTNGLAVPLPAKAIGPAPIDNFCLQLYNILSSNASNWRKPNPNCVISRDCKQSDPFNWTVFERLHHDYLPSNLTTRPKEPSIPSKYDALPSPGDTKHKMLNTILCGPPGTGKTFSTTVLALNAFLDDELDKALGSIRNLISESGDAWSYLRTTASSIIGSAQIDPPKKDMWATWTRTFHVLQKEGRICFTTFHQNYSYEDFIEGLRADAKNDKVTYRYEHGIFKRLCYQALDAWSNSELREIPFDLNHDDHKQLEIVLRAIITRAQEVITRDVAAPVGAARPYVLIIDEINRGNIARIFGELITLIEDSKRACFGGDIEAGSQPLWATLPYTRDKLIVPPNLYLLGTMNTADRSLIGLDVALRRRFSFVRIRPQPDLLGTVGDVKLSELLKAINNRIVLHLDEDHEIGHAYFLGVNTIGELKAAMLNKVLPQLLEYFHSNKETIVSILATKEKGESRFVSIANKRLIIHDRQFAEPQAYNSLIEYGVHPDADQF